MFAYRELLQTRSDEAFKQMVHELRLTPFQQQALREIVTTTSGNIVVARRQFEQTRHQMIVGAYRRMRAQLSPEQQTLLDKDFVSPALLAEVKAGEVAPTSEPRR